MFMFHGRRFAEFNDCGLKGELADCRIHDASEVSEMQIDHVPMRARSRAGLSNIRIVQEVSERIQVDQVVGGSTASP